MCKKMLLTRVMGVVILAVGMMTSLQVEAQTAAAPSQMEAKSKQLKKLRKQATDIYVDARRQKEIAQTALTELAGLYAEVEAKMPADLPAAALMMGEAYAAFGDRGTQMKYLHVVDSLYGQAPQQVKLWASIDLGWNHYRGFGTPQDEDKALDYFMRAYEADSIVGAFPMAMAALYGIGSMPVDLNMAASYLMQGQHGLRWPLIYAINFYLDNVGQTPALQKGWEDYLEANSLFSIYARPDEAIPCMQSAIDAGFMPACQLLGDLYLERGDREQAKAAVDPAIRAGYIPALHQKAWYIYSGTYGKMGQWKPIAEAYDLFRTAADAGYPPSQLTTSELCLVGSAGVVKVDYPLAYRYAVAADKAGEPLAENLVKRAQAGIRKEAFDGLKEAILNLKSSVDYYRILSAQKQLAAQAEQARRHRQADRYVEETDEAPSSSSSPSSRMDSEDRLRKAYRDNFGFYQYQTFYRDAISRVIKIETELKSDNRKGYKASDLVEAKSHARSIREKGNSYGKTSGNSINKSKYED